MQQNDITITIAGRLFIMISMRNDNTIRVSNVEYIFH